jgi:hypothetical protein
MTAGGRTVSGTTAGPVSKDFFIVSSTTPGSGLGVESGEAIVTATDGAGAPGGVGPVYEIGPEGLFSAPVWAWIPVSDDAGTELLCYLGEYGWLPVGQASGFLAGAEPVEKEIDGAPYIGIQVRHSALVRWGVFSLPVTALGASVTPASVPWAGAWGDGLVLLMALAALAAWSRARKIHA